MSPRVAERVATAERRTLLAVYIEQTVETRYDSARVNSPRTAKFKGKFLLILPKTE